MDIDRTSHGHTRSDRTHLDRHYYFAQAEYESAMNEVGIQPGWSVLDAGCGSGSYHRAILRSIGADGSILALDLAEENVRFANCSRPSAVKGAQVRGLVGRVNQLPLASDTFDCVWTANVLQYLTEDDFLETISEFKRVLKQGGTLAIKEADTSMYQIHPIDTFLINRLYEARRKSSSSKGIVGPWSGTSFSRRLRENGIIPCKRKGYLVERWAPHDQISLGHIEGMILYFASLSQDLKLQRSDKKRWLDICRTRNQLLRDPDLCVRESFVITIAVL